MSAQPIPTDSLLVGGKRNGERMRVPDDYHSLNVPVIPSVSYYRPDTPVEAVEYRTDVYLRRRLRPCWSAAMVDIWVLAGLANDIALALYQEWR